MKGQKAATTAQRLRTIMGLRGLRQVDVLDLARPFCEKFEVKLNKNDLSQYCSGKVEPGQDKLTILSMALSVSEAWLMGYDIPMEKQNQPAGSDELAEFVTLFEKLTHEEKVFILSSMQGILAARE